MVLLYCITGRVAPQAADASECRGKGFHSLRATSAWSRQQLLLLGMRERQHFPPVAIMVRWCSSQVLRVKDRTCSKVDVQLLRLAAKSYVSNGGDGIQDVEQGICCQNA